MNHLGERCSHVIQQCKRSTRGSTEKGLTRSRPWKCVPFESDMQPAVQREGEGEGEVGIAAATCTQGNGFTPDAVVVVWRHVTVRVSPQRAASASAPGCSFVPVREVGQNVALLQRVGAGDQKRAF